MDKLKRIYPKIGLQKSLAPGRHGDYIMYGGALLLWALRVQLAACHSAGT
jgi:hypothetical protein